MPEQTTEDKQLHHDADFFSKTSAEKYATELKAAGINAKVLPASSDTFWLWEVWSDHKEVDVGEELGTDE